MSMYMACCVELHMKLPGCARLRCTAYGALSGNQSDNVGKKGSHLHDEKGDEMRLAGLSSSRLL